MKQIIHSVIFLICSISNCWGQTINFTVIQLKAYLLNETCVDTSANPSWAGQFNVDLNNDNEIQISEALAVQHLILNDFGDNYSIQSLLDLNYFSNLTFLEVIQLDSLSEFRNMQLDSLKSLHIIDLLSIKNIDINNLPNLTSSLRIEGLSTLDTLNIKNGNVANYFSMFYTFDIKYACVDSIPS